MRTTLRLLLLLGLAATPAAAQSAANQPKQPPPEDTRRGYGAWFGSVPDMNDTGKGVLLDGISAGSPAFDAGLLKGDRIMMMAGDSVRDLREMVTVLRDHQPGETIEVIYIRKGATEKVKVTLGLRPQGG